MKFLFYNVTFRPGLGAMPSQALPIVLWWGSWAVCDPGSGIVGGGSLDCKEIKPVNPKGNQPFRIFIGRTDAEAETPILGLPDAKN